MTPHPLFPNQLKPNSLSSPRRELSPHEGSVIYLSDPKGKAIFGNEARRTVAYYSHSLLVLFPKETDFTITPSFA